MTEETNKRTISHLEETHQPEQKSAKIEKRILVITGNDLTPEELFAAVTEPTKVEISPECVTKISAVRHALDDYVEKKGTVYGVNTGFGSLSRVVVPSDQLVQMQYNIVRSHAFGVGHKSPHLISRMLIILRLNVFSRGHSGVSLAVCLCLRDAFNYGLAPHIPELGSVGASGDLAPLSHLALGVLGEPVPVDLVDVNNPTVVISTHQDCREVYHKIGMVSPPLQPKDGLCLVNGTQFIVAITTLALKEAEKVFESSVVIACLSSWALRGCQGAFSEMIHSVRPHPGQKYVADIMRPLLREMPRAFKIDPVTGAKLERTQDSYAIRCAPQIMGPVYEELKNIRNTLTIEMNSSTDNPLVFLHSDGTVQIESGGNFHGMFPAIAADKMTLVMTTLANLSNARVKRLINKDLSGLPSCLIGDEQAGCNSGLMIAEYSHTALNSEIVTNAFPKSAQSIPTCESQEDHVSMGPISARNAARCVQLMKQCLALELLCACQALDLLPSDIPRPQNNILHIIYQMVREKVPMWTTDHIPTQDIEVCLSVVDKIPTLLHSLHLPLSF